MFIFENLSRLVKHHAKAKIADTQVTKRQRAEGRGGKWIMEG
jgi:hypothetical protein